MNTQSALGLPKMAPDRPTTGIWDLSGLKDGDGRDVAVYGRVEFERHSARDAAYFIKVGSDVSQVPQLVTFVRHRRPPPAEHRCGGTRAR